MIMLNKTYWYYIVIFLISILTVFGFTNIKTYQNKKLLQSYSCPDCNVVLISVDTLRSDHVSSYGYYRKTTPNIDKFFQNGLYFRNATSASSWTLPATMSIFTGLLPSNHQVTNKLQVGSSSGEIENMTLRTGIKTIASVLKENNYQTGGFTGGAGVDSTFGFDRGFDMYFDKNNFGGLSDSISESLKWVEQNKDKKLFIFLHGYDVHGQFPVNYDKRFAKNYLGKLTGSIDEQKSFREDGLFNKKLSLAKDDVEFLVDLYDEKIQRMDTTLNAFFNAYPKLTNNKKTIYILVSDHGDEFYERGLIDHGHSLYNELINVPMMIKLPDFNTKIVYDNNVSNLDIFPTLNKLLNIEFNENLDGVNLFSSPADRKIISETQYRYVVDLKSEKTKNGWKLIENKTDKNREIYNTIFDFKEKKNLANFFKKLDNNSPKLLDLGVDF